MPERLDAELRARARRSLLRRDRALAPIIRRAGPCRMGPQGDPYGSLVRSIVYQQLQGKAGPRQVKNPHLGLTHNLGGNAGTGVCSCFIVGNDR